MTKEEQLIELLMKYLTPYGFTLADEVTLDPIDFVPRRPFYYKGKKLQHGWIPVSDEELLSTYSGIYFWSEIIAAESEYLFGKVGLLSQRDLFDPCHNDPYQLNLFSDPKEQPPMDEIPFRKELYERAKRIMNN